MRINGTWRTRQVWVNGRELRPERSQQVWNHSPDGFNWGYAGSGPAQLALAILLAAGCGDELAVRLHQRFKFDAITPLPQADFDVSIDVASWVVAAVDDPPGPN